MPLHQKEWPINVPHVNTVVLKRRNNSSRAKICLESPCERIAFTGALKNVPGFRQRELSWAFQAGAKTKTWRWGLRMSSMVLGHREFLNRRSVNREHYISIHLIDLICCQALMARPRQVGFVHQTSVVTFSKRLRIVLGSLVTHPPWAVICTGSVLRALHALFCQVLGG